MPKRREPFTIEMLHLLQTIAKGTPRNGILLALYDWFLLGLFLGLRRTEWAQPSSSPNLGSHVLDQFHNTQAFTVNDYRFESTSRQRFVGLTALSVEPTSLVKLFITFRTQKNGDNGEERLVNADWETDGNSNAIHAALNILQRHRRLLGTDTVTPLAIFHDGTSTRHITDSLIENVMRELARRVYKLDPAKDKDALSRWSSHSLRVGACVILHSTNRSSTDIKRLLYFVGAPTLLCPTSGIQLS